MPIMPIWKKLLLWPVWWLSYTAACLRRDRQAIWSMINEYDIVYRGKLPEKITPWTTCPYCEAHVAPAEYREQTGGQS